MKKYKEVSKLIKNYITISYGQDKLQAKSKIDSSVDTVYVIDCLF